MGYNKINRKKTKAGKHPQGNSDKLVIRKRKKRSNYSLILFGLMTDLELVELSHMTFSLRSQKQ